MRHETLRLATLLSLLGGTLMVAVTILLPQPQAVTGSAMQIDSSILRSAHLLRRRAFNAVLEQCDKLVGEGKDIACPDINDPEAVRAFLDGLSGSGATAVEHEAAPVLGVGDLNDYQLAILRRMTRVGSCDAERLNMIREGMYELCVGMVGIAGERGHMQQLLDRIEPQMKVQAPTWTLEEYLDAFGGKVRPNR